MRKDQITRRLKATIEMIEGLKNNQFHYKSIVEKYDEKNYCGTVCCVAGWYPKYFPKAGFEYKNQFLGGLTIQHKRSNTNIDIGLMEYHGLIEEIINFLFYGNDIVIELNEGFSYKDYVYPFRKKIQIHRIDTNSIRICTLNGYNSTRIQVLNAFKFILFLIENNALKNYKECW